MKDEMRGKVKTSFLKRAAHAALEVAFSDDDRSKIELSLFITDEQEMMALNQKYRKKASPTDVLSFSFQEKTKRKPMYRLPLPPRSPLFLGEIVLCYPYIRAQTREEGRPLPQALALAAIHGVLHLLGRNHRTRVEKQIMQDEEKRALLLFSNREY